MPIAELPRRRRLIAAAGALAALLALAGCASDGADAGGPASGGELLPAAEGVTQYPLTLETPFGETVLEERPERIAIVTAATPETDSLIALGGVPVLAPSTVERNPWLDAAALADVEELWESQASEELSAEVIAAAEPDLIVNLQAYETFDQARFDQLKAIAPVLYAPYSDELSWQEKLRRVAEAVDLSGAAEKRIAETEDAVASIAADHPEFAGRTATHVIVYEQEWGAAFASAPGSNTAKLFEALGLVTPPSAARFADDEEISDELIGLIDADFVLVSTFGGDTADYFVDSPLFRAVPAVADGRVAFNVQGEDDVANYVAWGLNQQSVLSVPWLLERFAGFAAEAMG